MNMEMREERLRSFAKQLGENTVDDLIVRGFLTAPASTRFHGSHEGGLFDHSLKVTERLLMLTRREKLVWERRESPIIVGMLHDLCKIDAYRPLTPAEAKERPGAHYAYAETEVKGHGEKSLIYARRIMELTSEEELCIRYHMGAFVEKEEWGEYTAAVQMFNNVLWTHTADMIASQIDRT